MRLGAREWCSWPQSWCNSLGMLDGDGATAGGGGAADAHVDDGDAVQVGDEGLDAAVHAVGEGEGPRTDGTDLWARG